MFISKHGTLDEHSKTKAATAGLIATCWAPLNQLSCQKDLPSAKHYPYIIYLYNEHLCRLSWCKKYWTCLQVSDNMFFWEHVSSQLLGLPFLQVRNGDFNIFQLSGQRCAPKAPLARKLKYVEITIAYCMNKDAPPNTIGSRGYGSNLGRPKVGRL